MLKKPFTTALPSWPFILLISLLAAATIFTNTPYHDTLYYWDWSRHLGLSYYDGPPLIAYIIKLPALIFGNTEATLNGLSVLFFLAIAGSIYLLGKTLFDKKVALLATVIWLVLPSSFLFFGLEFEYDSPVTLFTILTIYFFYCAHKKKSNAQLYLSSVTAGLMMLSKYTGVLLYLAIFVTIVASQHYRYLLKKPALYLALLLSLFIFSPVLIWNVQHDFASIVYQGKHGLDHHFQAGNLLGFLNMMTQEYSVIFIGFGLVTLIYFKKIINDEKLCLLFYTAAVPLLFFWVVSAYMMKGNWPETFALTACILVAYFTYQNKKWFYILNPALVILTVITTMIAIVVITQGHFLQLENKLTGLRYKRPAVAINKVYHQNQVVVSDNYVTASALAFFLKGKPDVMTLPHTGNQYQYWSENLPRALKQGKLKSVLYVTQNSTDDVALKTFSSCTKLMSTEKSHSPIWTAYRCVK